ncbi:cytochrome P450 [soil metagenome]
MNSIAQIAIPDHIRPDHVVDFDFYNDPRYHPDVHEGLAKLVAESPPVFWTPRYGGHWVAVGHAALFQIVRDTDNFSSEKMGIPAPEVEFKQIPINSDPPEHALYRGPLNKVFSPKAMMAVQDEVRALAIELIEKVRAQGHCDFAHAVAEPLPVSIFLKMMGLSTDKLPEYRKWVGEMLVSNDGEVRGRAAIEVVGAMSEVIQARMDKREKDLISTLLDTEIDGRSITFEEMQSFCLLLFVAGLDTVMNAMSFGVRHLAKNPELQAELRANPARITDAMEELLRRYTFTVPGRILVRDYEAFGVRFKAGERVLLMLPAGDLDAREFPDPLAFDMNRENKVHIAFNSGPHRCAGSHLARIELRILYEEWLRRIPEFRLDPDRPATFHGGHVIGVDSLPLIWDPD